MAFIVASVALLAALGGGVAAGVTISKLNGKERKQVKRIAKKLDKRIELLPGPEGPQGDPGRRGSVGPQGPAGSPDSPQQVRDKLTQVDGNGSGVDADQLDGIDSAVFGDAHNVLGWEFDLTDTTAGGRGVNGQCVYPASGAAGMNYVLHLPDSARVTNVRFYVYDNFEMDMTVELRSHLNSLNVFSQGQTVGEGTTSGEDPLIRAMDVPIAPNLAIENATHSYFLYAAVHAGSDDAICGARVDYEL